MIGSQKWLPFFLLCSKIAFNFRYIYMKLKLSVPNSLKEIQLKQYQEFLKAQEESDDPKFIASKIMQIFCGISLSETVQVKMSEINRVSTIITEMFDEKPSLITSFKMNGVEYGFIPDLDDISFGEYVDLDTYLPKWDMMEKAMGVLYRPITQRIGKKYTIEEYKGGDFLEMKEMPMDIVFGAMLFFYHLGIELSQVMMNYLEEGKLNLTLQQKEALHLNGDGIHQFTRSLKEILGELNISLN